VSGRDTWCPGGIEEVSVAAATDAVWIDVSMWTGLSGKVQPYVEVECEQPEPEPADPAGWQGWAQEHLDHVATEDGWQPGRYHFSVQRRDPSGRALNTFARGVWQWRT
jgi:hypothetical protein